MTDRGMRYDAAHIEVLEGRDAVRKRPGMYVGSTGQFGLHHLVLDTVDRAVGEVLAGRARRVDVTLTSDGGVRVADDGVEGGEACAPDLERELTAFRTGPGPSGRHTALLGGIGLGLFVTNALSSRLTAETWGPGTRWAQEYARGVEVAPPLTTGSETGSGATLSFWPDTEIFETTWFSFAVLADRFRQLAFLNRGLAISLTDERPVGGVRQVLFRFPDGARDFVAALAAETGAALERDIFGFEREDPRMAGTMEVALVWRGSGEARIRGYANSRATREGGTHVDGLRDGVVAAVTAFARERGLPAASDLDARADRIVEGLTAVVSVKLDHPEFQGATRELLGNTDVRVCVAEAVREHLGTWLAERPERVRQLPDRIVRGDEGD